MRERQQGHGPGNDGIAPITWTSSEIGSIDAGLEHQFSFPGIGPRSSSSLERNSLRIGEVFALL